MKKIYKIAKGLNNRFGGDDDPFRITTRLLEEAGEVASEVNHLERCGLKVEKAGEPDRKKLAKELQQVMRAIASLAIHYGIENELESSIEEYYQRVVSEGLVSPLRQKDRP